MQQILRYGFVRLIRHKVIIIRQTNFRNYEAILNNARMLILLLYCDVA